MATAMKRAFKTTRRHAFIRTARMARARGRSFARQVLPPAVIRSHKRSAPPLAGRNGRRAVALSANAGRSTPRAISTPSCSFRRS
jgi:hypothetical protein